MKPNIIKLKNVDTNIKTTFRTRTPLDINIDIDIINYETRYIKR